MKKTIALLLALVLCLSLCACGSNQTATSTTTDSTVDNTENTGKSDSNTEEPNEEPTDEPNDEPSTPKTPVATNGEWDEILCSGDGYYLVAKLIDTYDTYMRKLGVVNSDGEWVQELTVPGVFAQGLLKSEYDSLGFSYLGEGVFLASKGVYLVTTHFTREIGTDMPHAYVSTSYTGRQSYESSIHECFLWNVVDNTQTRFKASILSDFQDGYLFLCEQEASMFGLGSGTLYAMNTKFEITNLSCEYQPKLLYIDYSFPIYSEGLFFAYNDSVPGFYDIDGNLVISLSDYNLDWEKLGSVTNHRAPYFEDGKAILVAKNSGGSTYKITIDKSGTRIGEPEKLNIPSN